MLPLLLLFGLFTALGFAPANAANPSLISFQGKVVNADGTNVTNGAYDFDFVMYDDSALGTPSDGVHDKWHELTKSVTVTNGVFQTNLGSATALPDFNTNSSLYLAVRFNADAAGYMSPRVQMGSVPYAKNADTVGGVGSSTIVQLGATQSGNINISSGTITSGLINGQTISSAANFTGTLSVGGSSTQAFQVQNSSGNSVISVDSTGANAGNLVANPSFETTISGSGAGVWVKKGGSETVFANDTSQFYSSANSVKITTTSAAGDGIKQQLSSTLSASTAYNILFYAKLDSASAAFTDMQAGFSKDGAADDTPCALSTSIYSNGWTRYSCTFTTPSSGVTSGNYFYIKQVAGAVHTFYVDATLLQLSSSADSNYREGKVTLQGTITSPVILQNQSNSTTALSVQNAAGGQVFNVDTTDLNLLNNPANPSFEVNVAGWTNRNGGGGTAVISRDTSQAKYGLASLKVATTANAGDGARYTLSSGSWPAGTYTVAFSLINSGTAFASMPIIGFGNGSDNACNVITSSGTLPSTSGWTRYSATCTFTGTTTSIYIAQNEATAHNFYLDAVQLENGSNATAYGLGQISISGPIVTPVQIRNQSDSTNAFAIQNSAGTSNVLVADTLNKSIGINGNLTVNTSDNSIARTSYADFAAGTLGSSLSNSTTPSGQLELSDGTIPNSGSGTITTSSQPAVDANIGAGASAISRPDGKYLVIKGGSALTTSLYDSIAGTFTNSQTLVVGAGTVGAGSVVLPRPGGMHVVVLANGVVNTSNLDPEGTVTSTAGPSLTAAAGAGTVAFKRPDGKFLVALGAGAGTTNVYDPIANTFAAGPTNSGGVAWGAGSLALNRPDGSALIVTGGSASTTQIYNPSTANPSIGAFPSTGPSLDGTQTAGTCGINGSGSVALRRGDGKFVILSKVSVSALYDPVANTITCRTSNGPATAMGNGGHAIPLQDGKFLIIVGGGSTNSYIYDSSADSFTSHGTALTAVTTGAFSLMRQNGTWQIITGTNTCTNGCTNNYDTGLPMNGTATKYTSDDISTSALNISSTLKWNAQFESPYSAATNGSTNSAFSTIQFFVRTATNSGGCTTPLNSATDKELTNAGDFIRPGSTDNCVRITAQFNRPLPKRLVDERGTWTGNNTTVHRLDYATPTLFDVSVDNSTVLHRDNFTFSQPGGQEQNNGTIPTALTATQSAGGGSCTAGTHSYYVTFITDGVESALGAKSNVITCVGGTDKVNLTSIPTGITGTGTTARKIYRTAAGDTSSPFLLTTISDNTTTSLTSDTAADSSLGAAYISQSEPSGPVVTRVEAVNGALTLPMGRLAPTTKINTTQFYAGVMSRAHPAIPQAQTTTGTIVIARPNRTFVVIAALSTPAANAALYDPATQTFTSQASPNIPTAANGSGGFAVKRPDGKFLVIMGNNTAATNVYDANSNTFTAGPSLSGLTGVGASAIPNTDGSLTIVHGNGLTTSTIYDPIRNTVTAGPTLTTAANCGFWAIPLQNGMYKTFAGVAGGVIGATTSMNYNPNTKTFTSGLALTGAHGCGSFAFQRPDGWWLSVTAAGGTAGAAQGQTAVINPVDGTSAAGPTFTNVVGQGGHVIPRADGTFLIVDGGGATATNVYIPYGATFAAGANIGSVQSVNSPALTAASGVGAVSFQRPDGKWVIINGNTTATANLYDAGWYPDGQYLSEQIQVPALAANSVLNWRQTNDNFVRMEARAASSQAALSTTGFNSVGRPGTSIGNSGGETWVQVEVNFRRDFPTFGGSLDGVYVSGGGAVYKHRTISQPAITSYDINNGNDLLTLQDNGLNVLRVTSECNIYSSSNGGFYSGGADLAENYTSTESLAPGDVVVMDSANNHSIKKSTGEYQPNLLGVISTAPGFVAGAFTDDSHPVALVGRVPVKVSSENGIVHAGDFLTSASIPGYAMKATVAGRVIGTALEGFDPSASTQCPGQGRGNLPAAQCGLVMMFVNLTDYQGASTESLIAEADQLAASTGNAQYDIPDLSFPGVDEGGLTSSLGINSWSSQAKTLGFLQSLRDKQNSGQAPVGSDILATNINASNQLITPTIVADLIRAKTIKADHIEGLEIYTDKLGSLSDQYASLQQQVDQLAQGEVASPQAKGSIKFASGQFAVSLISLGTIESRGGLTVGGDAQFNGRSTFAGLVQLLNDVSAQGRVTFNKDSGGSAVIKKGANKVSVSFDKQYAQQPVVSISMLAAQRQLSDGSLEDISATEQRLFDAGYSYLVSNLNTKGFTIVLNKKALEDLDFTWSAVSIKDAATVTGLPDTSN